MSYAQNQYKHIREPFFEVWINDTKLSSFRHKLIEEVRYEDHATGSDICSVTFVDSTFELISDPIFTKRTPFKLFGGYRLDYREMIDGFISAVDYNFPEDGTPTITIHAMDKSHVMDRIEVKRTFEGTSRLSVAKQIAKDHGLAFSGTGNERANKVEKTITQSNETDIQFLIKLANECEMIVYVKGSTLYFHERGYAETPQAKAAYRKVPFNVISFLPRFVQKDIPEEEIDDDITDTGDLDSGLADDTTPRDSVGATGNPYGDGLGDGKLEYIDGTLYLDGKPFEEEW